MKRLLVLGATSGVAQAFCCQALEQGYSLILGARDEGRLSTLARDLEIRAKCGPIPHLRFDASNFQSHAAFLQEVLAQGELAGCFIACGVLHPQEQGEREWKCCEEMIDGNYAGIVSMTNLLASYFSERRSGFISCISSVAGDRGRQSNYIYGSTKAGLNAYLEGLRNRLHERGVLVQTIKLGPVDTPMNVGVQRTPFMISPESAAEAILKALEKRRDVVYVPRLWFLIMLAIRLMPRSLFKRMKL